jgi:hypothetical protein
MAGRPKGGRKTGGRKAGHAVEDDQTATRGFGPGARRWAIRHTAGRHHFVPKAPAPWAERTAAEDAIVQSAAERIAALRASLAS